MKMRTGWLAMLSSLVAVTAMAEKKVNERTSVFAGVYNGYTRTKDAAGRYRQETFIFGNGGYLPGAVRDKSIDELPFLDLARLVAGPLQEQNYVAATDPEKTDLFIMIYWGVTAVAGNPEDSIAYDNLSAALAFEGTAMQGDPEFASAMSMVSAGNVDRDIRNFRNARILGYHQALRDNYGIRFMGVRGSLYNDLASEVEESRYFVILMAFDFRTAWKTKQLKPMWSARYNIPAKGNNFAAALPDMTRFASRYFGRDSKGLVRRSNPTGRVEMGDAKVLGVVEPK